MKTSEWNHVFDIIIYLLFADCLIEFFHTWSKNRVFIYWLFGFVSPGLYENAWCFYPHLILVFLLFFFLNSNLCWGQEVTQSTVSGELSYPTP